MESWKQYNQDLSSLLRRLISQTSDIRFASLYSSSGVDLMTETKGRVSSDECALINHYVSSFVASLEQSVKLGVGSCDCGISFIPSFGVLVQTRIETLILTVCIEEGANIGLMEENLYAFKTLLRPFCVSFLAE